MRIRTQFAFMVVGVTVIPVLLLALGWVFMTLNQSTDPIPAYEQLPQGSEGLTDAASWAKIRELLSHRPAHTQTFVFDDSFRLIFSSAPIPEVPPGSSLAPESALTRLRAAHQDQDIFMFKMADTRLWMFMVRESSKSFQNPLSNLLILAGIILLGILVSAVVFSIILGGNLTRSIVVLEKAVRKVADGDLDFRVDEVKGSNEIRNLGRSFDELRLSLREENARKSRFVMGLSHDLKTPLALIKGYTELLRDGPVPDRHAQENHLELILDKVDQLDTMIEDLIEYSKVNTGEWQQIWTDVPMKDFLEEYGPTAAQDAKLLGRTFETLIDLPAGLTVACDPRSIRRCLENMASNALRYTREGGRVGITAAMVGGAVELVVWDNGPGIAAQDLPHIFELFYRGSHSRRESGMGIGLTVVKTPPPPHGWSIRAESQEGTRFIITIPVAANAGSAS